MRALVVTIVVGVGILSLPGKLSRIQGNDGWMIIIASGLLICIPLIIINKIFQLYPDKDFFEIGEEVLGKWMFKVVLLILGFNFIINAALITRHLAEIIKAFLLITTPMEVIIITFIIATSYLARSDMHIIGRASYHIYPLIIGFVIMLVAVSITQVDFTNLLPVLQSDFSNIPKSLSLTFVSFTGIEVLLFFIPFAEDKGKTLGPALKGVAIITIIYTLIFLISLSQYGLTHLQRQTFSTLSYIKEVDLPGFFIENLDGFVVAIWVLIVFATMGAYYYSSGIVLANLFNAKSHEIFILPLLPIIYMVSLVHPNLIALDNKLGKLINYTGVLSMILIPVIIYSLGYYKLRRAKG